MFWAFEEWREKWLAIGRHEGMVEGLAKGKAETEQRYEAWLAKVARERDVPLDDLLPPSEGYTKGSSEGLVTGYAAAKYEFDKRLEYVAAEKGIPLAELLPPEQNS